MQKEGIPFGDACNNVILQISIAPPGKPGGFSLALPVFDKPYE